MERGFRGGIGQTAILALAVALILFEYQSFWPFPATPAAIPDAVTALAARDDVRAVFNIPWDNLLAAKDALYLQTGHQHPLIAGQITRRTPVSPAKLALLQGTLDPALLDAAGVDIVILHKQYDYEGQLGIFTRRQLGEPLYEDDALAIFEAPETRDEPQFTALDSLLEAIHRQVDLYLYTPAPGWAQLSGQLEGNRRTVQLWIDNRQAHTWRVDSDLTLDLPVPLPDAGYHTVTLALSPPCPLHHNPTLECDSVRVNHLVLDRFTPAALDTPVLFERGIQLASARIPDRGRADETVSVWLWWRFDQPRSDFDVRFVHLLDEQGNLVAQADSTLGAHPAGSQWVETVDIFLPANLRAGTYRVYTGWYAYPDTARFAVLSDIPGADSGLALLGTLVVE